MALLYLYVRVLRIYGHIALLLIKYLNHDKIGNVIIRTPSKNR